MSNTGMICVCFFKVVTRVPVKERISYGLRKLAKAMRSNRQNETHNQLTRSQSNVGDIVSGTFQWLRPPRVSG